MSEEQHCFECGERITDDTRYTPWYCSVSCLELSVHRNPGGPHGRVTLGPHKGKVYEVVEEPISLC